MPLKSGYSHQTFSANLAELIRAGHERNSAIMAAASKARQSFFRRFPAGALPNWLAFPKTARTANHYDGGGRPLIGRVKSNPRFAGQGAYRIWFVNHDYWSQETFDTFREAAAYVKSKGFEASIYQRIGNEDRFIAFWGPIGGMKMQGAAPMENPRFAQPNPAALALAAKLYSGFTGKNPKKVRKLDVSPMPQAGLAIGKVFGIMYSVDATGERFHHEFKRSAQPLLIVSPDGQQVFLHGGAYTFTKRGFVDH